MSVTELLMNPAIVSEFTRTKVRALRCFIYVIAPSETDLLAIQTRRIRSKKPFVFGWRLNLWYSWFAFSG
jgi:hypothetical protein